MFTPSYQDIGTKRVLIISDIHLGSLLSNVRMALRILKRERFDILIVLGDLFDSNKLDRLKGRHWSVLSRLRKLSKTTEILYLTGNHCFLPAKFMSQLLGLTCLDTYGALSGGKQVYFAHGDHYDLWCANKRWATRLGTWLKHLIEVVDPKMRHLGKLGRLLDRYSSLAETVKFVALKHAKVLQADWIVCGHTHVPELQLGEISYANSGGLVEGLDSYLILENGTITLHHGTDLKKPKVANPATLEFPTTSSP